MLHQPLSSSFTVMNGAVRRECSSQTDSDAATHDSHLASLPRGGGRSSMKDTKKPTSSWILQFTIAKTKDIKTLAGNLTITHKNATNNPSPTRPPCAAPPPPAFNQYIHTHHSPNHPLSNLRARQRPRLPTLYFHRHPRWHPKAQPVSTRSCLPQTVDVGREHVRIS